MVTPTRRQFLKTAAILGAGLPRFTAFAMQEGEKKPARIAFFQEQGFPAGEIGLPPVELLRKDLDGFDLLLTDARGLQNLPLPGSAGGVDLLVMPYGSFFPLEAYEALIAWLGKGGNWLNLGGVPLSQPVTREGPGWRVNPRTTAYHRRLGILQSFRVRVENDLIFETTGEELLDKDAVRALSAAEIEELYLRFSSVRDVGAEEGSPGQREALLEPLVVAVRGGEGEARTRVAAPILAIDRLLGEFAGGRWVLANFTGKLDGTLVNVLARSAMKGATSLAARPSFACFREGEAPSLALTLRRPQGGAGAFAGEECEVEITGRDRRSPERYSVALHGGGTIATGLCALPAGRTRPPGLYHVALRLRGPNGRIAGSTGFWIDDRRLMEGGSPLTAGTDLLLRDGKPFPVHGTTYMASDVHRKFLFEADPAVWDRDFREMREAGINMVRTGIWSGWKSAMPEVGAIDEGHLRALDAFFLTTRRYDMPVIFTFFAFMPESWGGINPYLDPRSVAAQEAFILGIAGRYRSSHGIVWDLINEPSFCNPEKVWETRPHYDKFEGAAWGEWLKARYPAPDDAARSAFLQSIYRTTAERAASLPTPEDFEDVNLFEGRTPLKVVDYRLFAQEMFARWSAHMGELIRKNAPGQLVTVGQDEGGTADRPSPQFFAPGVDFTCVHTWWYNDDLLWDSIVTRVAGKPNLVEETGVMFTEKPDGMPWRSETDAAALLERKLAIAAGAGSAGFVEWIWNTNPYMASDNEAAIGLHRADGTAKPELAVVEKFSRFFDAHRGLLTGRKPDDILLVIPHTGQFSTRDMATAATQRAVRILGHDCNVGAAAVSEYRLDAASAGAPKLVIVPSVQGLAESAWHALLSLAEKGSTVLITGVIDLDEHLLPAARAAEAGLGAPGVNAAVAVSAEEMLRIDSKEYLLGFRGKKTERVLKQDAPAGVAVAKIGNGAMLWSPVPLELSENEEACAALYSSLATRSGVFPAFAAETRDPSTLILTQEYADALLVTCVSSSSHDTEMRLVHTNSKAVIPVTLPAGRSAVMFVSKTDGSVIANM